MISIRLSSGFLFVVLVQDIPPEIVEFIEHAGDHRLGGVAGQVVGGFIEGGDRADEMVRGVGPVEFVVVGVEVEDEDHALALLFDEFLEPVADLLPGIVVEFERVDEHQGRAAGGVVFVLVFAAGRFDLGEFVEILEDVVGPEAILADLGLQGAAGLVVGFTEDGVVASLGDDIEGEAGRAAVRFVVVEPLFFPADVVGVGRVLGQLGVDILFPLEGVVPRGLEQKGVRLDIGDGPADRALDPGAVRGRRAPRLAGPGRTRGVSRSYWLPEPSSWADS